MDRASATIAFGVALTSLAAVMAAATGLASTPMDGNPSKRAA
jgi:hypothetical protein